jgi:hypothetical protein
MNLRNIENHILEVHFLGAPTFGSFTYVDGFNLVY